MLNAIKEPLTTEEKERLEELRLWSKNRGRELESCPRKDFFLTSQSIALKDKQLKMLEARVAEQAQARPAGSMKKKI